jgi:stearoyl-CoA desaturase (delta-9 desaturase)
MIDLLRINEKNQTLATCVSQPVFIFSVLAVFVFNVSAWWLLLTFLVYMGMQISITVGCHRLFTHRTFHCNRFWHYVFSYFTVITWQASTISWVNVHYNHHLHSDTDQDPHITSWDFLIKKRYKSLSGKYSRVVANMAKDPMHLFFHNYSLPIIFGTGLVLYIIDPLAMIYGLIAPMGYYFITSGFHQILSHRNGAPRNLFMLEFILPMGEWIHADHHKDSSKWDFGKWDIGTYLIRLIKT